MMGICQHSLFVGLATSVGLLVGPNVFAGVLVTSLGSPVQIGLDGFLGSGFVSSPMPGQLDSDHWRITGLSDGAGVFGGSHSTGDFARGKSPGGVTSGGVHGFDVESGDGVNLALGFQPITSDLTPGEVTLRIINGTGQTADRLDLAYRLYVRNDENRSSSFRFAYSLDDVSYHSLTDLDAVSEALADLTPAWIAIPRMATLQGLSLPAGAPLFLQWQLDDRSGTGGRDEWALDDIDVRLDRSLHTVPEPASWVLLGMIAPVVGFVRSRRVSASLGTPAKSG
jgi:hypothetical protein